MPAKEPPGNRGPFCCSDVKCGICRGANSPMSPDADEKEVVEPDEVSASVPSVLYPPPTNVAPRPHWWTVIPNWVAILVSFISCSFSYCGWHETMQNRRVNETASRAYIRVSSILLDTNTLYAHRNPGMKYLSGVITITNTGRAAAQNVRINQALMSSNPNDPHNLDDGAIAHLTDLHVLGPTVPEVVRFSIPVLYVNGKFDQTNREFNLNLTIVYNDGIHPRDNVESPMFCAPIPREPQRQLLQFYSCNTIVGLMNSDGTPLKNEQLILK
jgi:hypothetical protein